MRVVARTAPEPAAAVPGACTQRKLFGMADHFHRSFRTVPGDINGVSLLNPLPRPKVCYRLPGIWNSDFTRQVTLLTDAIASRRIQLRRIDNRSRHGILHMLRCVAVAAVAPDRVEQRLPIPVQSAVHAPGLVGMTC